MTLVFPVSPTVAAIWWCGAFLTVNKSPDKRTPWSDFHSAQPHVAARFQSTVTTSMPIRPTHTIEHASKNLVHSARSETHRFRRQLVDRTRQTQCARLVWRSDLCGGVSRSRRTHTHTRLLLRRANAPVHLHHEAGNVPLCTELLVTRQRDACSCGNRGRQPKPTAPVGVHGPTVSRTGPHALTRQGRRSSRVAPQLRQLINQYEP